MYTIKNLYQNPQFCEEIDYATDNATHNSSERVLVPVFLPLRRWIHKIGRLMMLIKGWASSSLSFYSSNGGNYVYKMKKMVKNQQNLAQILSWWRNPPWINPHKSPYLSLYSSSCLFWGEMGVEGSRLGLNKGKIGSKP